MYKLDKGGLMKSSEPLQGLELIDCARANGNESLETAAERCGYHNNIAAFEQELRKAGEAIGVKIQDFSDLNTSSTDAPSLPSQI
jgi:hypothetical protein